MKPTATATLQELAEAFAVLDALWEGEYHRGGSERWSKDLSKILSARGTIRSMLRQVGHIEVTVTEPVEL